MKTPFPCSTLALLIWAVAAPLCPAAETPQPAPVCHESARFLVVELARPGQGGTDFIIRRKKNPGEKPVCESRLRPGDFEIPNQWAEYFAGLRGDLLLLDSTTGPGPSGLIIWDLEKEKKVYQGSWSDPEPGPAGKLVFWLETGEANRENCPQLAEWQAHGLGGALETRVQLDLTDFTLATTTETRCSPRQ